MEENDEELGSESDKPARKLPFGSEFSSKRKKEKRVRATASKSPLKTIPENVPPSSLKRTKLTDYFSPRKSPILSEELESEKEDLSPSIRDQCEAEEVPEKFLALVKRCQTVSPRPLSEVEVLAELIRTSGLVKDTIARFKV